MNDINDVLKIAEELYNKKDYKNSFLQYMNAAKSGHIESQTFVGWMLFNGIGIEKNIDEALYWFKISSDNGSVDGEFYYARTLTSTGKHAEAYKIYYQLSNSGNLASIFRVGHSLIHGKGVEIDCNKGYHYLSIAASEGHVFALREIALLYIGGYKGPWFRIVGVYRFFYAFIKGIIVGNINGYSEKLRG